MRINFLGTSNANPNPGHGQTGIIFETGRSYYLFDCGDGVATKLWLDAGTDWGRLRGVFISHLHPDHAGGIFSLLQLVHQRAKIHSEWEICRDRTFHIYLPNRAAGVLCGQLQEMMHGCCFNYQFTPYEGDGQIHTDNDFKVNAIRNRHIEFSYSFLINAEGKKIVYSGDLRSPNELAIHSENADLLIIEGAHFGIESIVETFRNVKIGRIIITHLLDEYIADKSKVIELLTPLEEKIEVSLASDGMVVEL